MIKRKHFLLILPLLALVGAVVGFCSVRVLMTFIFPFFYSPSQLIGRPAPEFTLDDLEGNKVSLSHFYGQVVLLNFWSYG